jgi:hypothetical protein
MPRLSVKQAQIIRIPLPLANQGVEKGFGVMLICGASDMAKMLQRVHDQPVETFECVIHTSLLIPLYRRNSRERNATR